MIPLFLKRKMSKLYTYATLITTHIQPFKTFNNLDQIIVFIHQRPFAFQVLLQDNFIGNQGGVHRSNV